MKDSMNPTVLERSLYSWRYTMNETHTHTHFIVHVYSTYTAIQKLRSLRFFFFTKKLILFARMH